MVLFYSLSPLTFLFQYKESGAFTVLVDNYVKEEEGTGIVHQAPYFGAVSSINLASVLMRSKCHWPLSCVCVCDILTSSLSLELRIGQQSIGLSYILVIFRILSCSVT